MHDHTLPDDTSADTAPACLPANKQAWWTAGAYFSVYWLVAGGSKKDGKIDVRDASVLMQSP